MSNPNHDRKGRFAHYDEKGQLAPAQSRIARRLRGETGPSSTTKKWRIAVRGEDRATMIADEAAKTALAGGFIEDKHSGKMLLTRAGMRQMRRRREGGSPKAWERRRLAGMPGAKFNDKGQLANYEEMLARYGKKHTK